MVVNGEDLLQYRGMQMETNRRIRFDSEWMELITECRQSGLSDYAWCSAKNIPSSSFYNAVARLRKKACSIPEPSGIAPVIDLTSRKQEVVQIDIVPDAEGNTSPFRQNRAGVQFW